MNGIEGSSVGRVLVLPKPGRGAAFDCNPVAGPKALAVSRKGGIA